MDHDLIDAADPLTCPMSAGGSATRGNVRLSTIHHPPSAMHHPPCALDHTSTPPLPRACGAAIEAARPPLCSCSMPQDRCPSTSGRGWPDASPSANGMYGGRLPQQQCSRDTQNTDPDADTALRSFDWPMAGSDSDPRGAMFRAVSKHSATVLEAFDLAAGRAQRRRLATALPLSAIWAGDFPVLSTLSLRFAAPLCGFDHEQTITPTAPTQVRKEAFTQCLASVQSTVKLGA
jgi:hypothetical protein